MQTTSSTPSTAAPGGTGPYLKTAQEIEADYGIDLILAETLRQGLVEVAREMTGTLMRSAYSGVVRDGRDFGVNILYVNDDDAYELVATSDTSQPQFGYVHQHLANMVLEEYGIENLGMGDTIVCNDSYRGAIHFSDINFIRVVRDEEGKPIFVITDGAHLFDIGGAVAGGFNYEAREIYEEGLRLPPMLITSADTIVRPVINLLVENTRSPFHTVGDIKALLGTLRSGEGRLQELLTRYGPGALRGASRYSLDLAERRMRNALETVEDGDYEATGYLDDDGVEIEKPIEFQVSVRVRGSNAEIDFSGTDRQPIGAACTCWEEAGRCISGPKVLLDPMHEFNAGSMRPFDVLLPAGSAVLALPPSSQSNHPDVGVAISSLMLEVMSKAVPSRALAPDAGCCGVLFAHGMDDRPGREGMPFGTGFLGGASWGGTQVSDGISFCFPPIFNVQALIIEYEERSTPLVFWEFGAVIDAAGAGHRRGGYSAAFTIEALADTYYTPMLDRASRPPNGAGGGGPGMTSYGFLVEKDEKGSPVSHNGLIPADRITPLFGIYDDRKVPDPEGGSWANGAAFRTSKVAAAHLAPGQVLRMMTASAGGYGDPLDREPELVERDVADLQVSPRQARELYGVIVDPETLELDEAATASERERARSARGPDWSTPIAHFADWPVTGAELEALKQT